MPMYSLLFVVGCLTQISQDPKTAYESAMAVVEHQERLIKCWRLDYKTAAKSINLGSKSQPGSQESSFGEVRSGNRYRSKRATKTADGKSGVNDMMENGFDGKQYRQYTPQENHGSLNSKNGVDHSYLMSVYGSQQTLSGILQSGKAQVNCRWANLEGRSTLECVIPEANGLVRSLYLDPEQGWQPRRIVLDQTIPAGAYADGRRKEVTVINAKEFLQRDGVFLPSVVEIIRDAIFEADRRVRIQESRIQVSSVAVNPVIPDAEFTIEFPNGTAVHDRDRDVVYIQGKPGTEKSAGSRNRVTPPVSPSGTRWVWWADWRAWTGFAAVAGIALGALHWKESRS